MRKNSPSRRRPTWARNRRGSALLVAVIMIVVTVAMVELALSAPSAELLKVRSTVGKEHAMASADAGLRDALVWLNANKGSLNTLLTNPTATNGGAPYHLSAGSKVIVTATGSTQGPTQTTIPLLTLQQAVQLNQVSGLYPFPGSAPWAATSGSCLNGLSFCDTNDIANTTSSNFLRFGDPIVSRGEYAYRITALDTTFSNMCYQVDVEGRAQGVALGNGSSRGPYTPTRLTAVVRRILQPAGDIPAAANIVNPSHTATTPGSFSILATGNPGSKNTEAISGVDAAGTGVTVAGLAIETPSGINFATNNGNTVAGNPPIAVGTGSGATQIPQTTWDGITDIVDQAAGLTSGQSVNVPGTALSPGMWTGTYGVQSLPSKGIGIFYMKIPDGSTVSSGPLMTVTGASGSTGGILILDVGDGVTFSNASPLLQGDGKHPFQGTVILYQRGAMNITTTTKINNVTTPTLNLFYQNGNQADGLQYDSTNIVSALNVLGDVQFRIDAYIAR
jgi:hypothetical protein